MKSLEYYRGREQTYPLGAALQRLRCLVGSSSATEYDQALAALLEIPLVWESDVKKLILHLRDAGELEVQGLGPRERTPKPGHVLVPRSKSPAEA